MLRNEKGLTLIELLASMVILAVFAIGFATMLMNGIKANELNRIEMEATMIAQSEIEKMRLSTEPNFCTSSVEEVESFQTNRTANVNGGMCQISVEVSGGALSDQIVTLNTELNLAQKRPAQ